MPTLNEYFQKDFDEFSLNIDTGVNVAYQKLDSLTQTKTNGNFEVRLSLRHYAKTSSRLFTFYIPETPDTCGICEILINDLEKFKSEMNNMIVIGGFTGDLSVGTHTMIYSNRVFFYTERFLSNEEINHLNSVATSKSLYLTIRSSDYLKQKGETEKPFAFISHDTRDKDLIAKKLANGLNSRLCYTWYDEYSLKIGDSLRESIEKGIKEAKKCILILTQNYLANPGWSKKEFNSIFTREMITKEKVVLPIWYGVTAKEVYEYSPSLADTFALTWVSPENKSEEQYKQEVEQIISKVHTAIMA